MSNMETEKPYMYQPYGMQDEFYWENKLIYGVVTENYIIKGLTKDNAELIVKAINEATK